jgi:hypothetical protein
MPVDTVDKKLVSGGCPRASCPNFIRMCSRADHHFYPRRECTCPPGRSFVLRETSRQFSLIAVAQMVLRDSARFPEPQECSRPKNRAERRCPTARSTAPTPFVTQGGNLAGNIGARSGRAKKRAKIAGKRHTEISANGTANSFRTGNPFAPAK